MPAALIPAAVGAAGIYSANQQANAQRKAQRQGLRAAQEADAPRSEALRMLLDQASRYDPHAENSRAIADAEASTGRVLGRDLGNMRAKWLSQGGTAGDTEFGVRAQDVANRAVDPLREFTAQLRSGETMRKIAALQTVTGAPTGQLSQSYFQAANQMPGGDYGPGLQLLADALRTAGKKKPGATGDALLWQGGPQTT